MDNPIIVALDGLDMIQVAEMAKKLKNDVWGFKFNDLLSRINGLLVIDGLSENNAIMVDPKYHDIPNTVGNSCAQLKEAIARVGIVTVHASGGPEMIKAAVEVFPEQIAAVTLLTSISEELCHSQFNQSTDDFVTDMAGRAQEAGASYIVCSPQELESLANITIPKIVPGIRPVWYQEKNDQQRVSTPVDAMEKGAKFLVMGRAILKDPDPVAAAQRTLDEIRKG